MSTTPTELLESIASTEEVLDFNSIKEAMDAFDPASLLPELSEIFGSIAVVCRWAIVIGPVVMLILGLAYLLLSPREANYYFGYRCYFGMGSVPAWRFTQRFAGLILGGTGLALTLWMVSAGAGFAKMEVTEMVWQALDYLVIQAVAAFLANLVINLTAMLRFNRRGEYRRAVRAEKKQD